MSSVKRTFRRSHAVFAAFGLVVAMGGSPAKAALVIDTTTYGAATYAAVATSTGSGNSVISNTFGVGATDGWFGASIFETVGASLRFDLWGFEAQYRDEFTALGIPGGTISNFLAGGCCFASNIFGTDSPLASAFGSVAAAGPLDFSFFTGALFGGGSKTVTNAGNYTSFHTAGQPNFLASLNPFDPTDGSIILWLDDSGGQAGVADGDYDDMVIRITQLREVLPPVPLPLSLPLFGGGLGLLLWLKRRRAEPLGWSAAA